MIDFTVPYYDLVGLTILLKKPEFDYELFKFLIVLDENVWLCIIASYFLFSGLLYAFDKLSPYSYQNNRRKYENVTPEPRIFTIKEGIWFCMMSLTPQGLSVYTGCSLRNVSQFIVNHLFPIHVRALKIKLFQYISYQTFLTCNFISKKKKNSYLYINSLKQMLQKCKSSSCKIVFSKAYMLSIFRSTYH